MGERRSRDELEALAFGADAAPAERAEALRALGYATAPATAPEAMRPDLPDDDGAADVAPVSAPPDPAAPTHRRGLRIAGRIAAGVGLLAIGIAVGHYWAGVSAMMTAEGSGSAVRDPAATSRLAAGDPAVEPGSADTGGYLPDDTLNSPQATDPAQPGFSLDPAAAAAAADTLFTEPRTSVDEYVFSQGNADAEWKPSTTHLVLTSRSGMKVYVARASGDGGGYCLLVTQEVNGGGGGLSGTNSCASLADFSAQGIQLTINSYSIVWWTNQITVLPSGQ